MELILKSHGAVYLENGDHKLIFENFPVEVINTGVLTLPLQHTNV